MPIQLVYTVYPPSNGDIVFGIENRDAVTELSTHFDISEEELIRGGMILSIPFYSTDVIKAIHSTELTNIFKNHSEKDIFIHPSADNYASMKRWPTDFHT